MFAQAPAHQTPWSLLPFQAREQAGISLEELTKYEPSPASQHTADMEQTAG